VAFDGKDLWITTPGSGTTKVSGTTGALLMYDPALGGANGTNGIAFDGQYIWVLSDMSGDTVYKVDVTTNQIVATVLAYPGVHTLAFDGTLIWVVCTNSDMIVKIDTRTNQIVGTIQLPTGSEAYDIAFDGTHMWVTTMASGRIHKFVAHF
jgi:DNA-binding beta-propeller fold protein YncE